MMKVLRFLKLLFLLKNWYTEWQRFALFINLVSLLMLFAFSAFVFSPTCFVSLGRSFPQFLSHGIFRVYVPPYILFVKSLPYLLYVFLSSYTKIICHVWMPCFFIHTASSRRTRWDFTFIIPRPLCCGLYMLSTCLEKA